MARHSFVLQVLSLYLLIDSVLHDYTKLLATLVFMHILSVLQLYNAYFEFVITI